MANVSEVVIEDSEPERAAIRNRIARAPIDLGVIEITDSDSEGSDSGALLGLSYTPTSATACGKSILSERALPITKVIDTGKQPSSSCLNLVRDGALNGEEDSDVEEIEAPRKLDIAQFAFSTGINQKASTSKLKSQPTIGEVTLPRSEPTKKARSGKAPILSLSSEFTDKDYDKVLRCIACDARWTTRKSAAQKMQHMRSCCKKAAYNQETIDILLRKAIDEALPPSNPPPQEESTTLFNDYNPPAAKKKKKTRPEQPKNTVADVVDTRAEILNRAQLYLQSPPSQGNHRVEPPPTQQFGRSKLGAARRTMTLLDQEQEVSPLKGKSSAARFSPNTDSTRDAGKEELASSLNPLSLQGASETTIQTLEPAPSSRHRSKSRTPRKEKKTKSTRAPKEVYDTAWEDALRDKITADEALHLRMLRYEPIDFDLFLSIAAGGTKLGTRLKESVKSFLDKEGIHYYTSEWY